ncbi:integrin alpha-4 [Cynoglossus semilaevis]|uniref:Integrin subunit alpha 4 n=1 Tax=Cynoglossus semilaevis TaxID=244447 RepID=A0A3P8V0Q2_CYNSE|nr:integrin alpha-4 [Cynoglossus semilaevis]XP_024919435.1 integrin alpha-4 [Cynoglossus semilaevis]
MYHSAFRAAVCCSLFLVLLQFLVQFLLLVNHVEGYNLDQGHSLEFSGPSSSMFGYSVLLHRHKSHKWLVVGAPVANTSSSHVLQSPGAVFRCNITAESHHCHPMPADVLNCGKTCESESDHQWLGVSLSRQPGDNGGHILACAHRWKNAFYSKQDSQSNKLPHGVCYLYGSDLKHGQPIIPCYRDHQRKFGQDYGSCQAGISNFLTEDLIIMGAPGTSYWTGSVLVFNTSSLEMSGYLDYETGAVTFGSYLGYSVGAGHFLSPATVEVVGGAPQYNQRGKVYIFTIENNHLRIVSDVAGEELGSYFGSSVCAVDVNADGLSDLLVGAPLSTGAVREEGRVHVYINQGQAQMMEADYQLSGSNAYAARFGETIADLGDLDDDGYNDVAIGAPQEDDLKGAIYIYNGRSDGISPTPSQRISGSTLGRDLRMFGQSLSSGIDIDDNGYQDLAVGAFLSDSAVVLRTRPVIQVKASLALPEQIDQKTMVCRGHKTPTVCFNVTVCFSVKSRQYKGVIDLQYNLTSDLLHKPSFPHRFYFHGNGSSNSTRGHVRARQGHLTCTTHVAYQRKDVRDIFTPVQFKVAYGLKENSQRTHSKHFPPLKPILQQSKGQQNTITNQTQFARSCSLLNCSTNMQLSAELMLPDQQQFFALGSGQTIMLKTTMLNSGDDAFLPRLMLQFPDNIHYVKVLQNQDNTVNCDVTQEVNSTAVVVDCSVTSFLLLAKAQMNINFLLDVSQNSTPGDISIHVNTSSDNYEKEEYLHDNALSLLLPLKYGVNINFHGYVTPNSFVFGDEELTPVECYAETFNYTYKVLNSGPSRSLDTVVEITLPKILAPYRHRLQQVVDWQSSQGVCSISDSTVSVIEDCDVPQASFIKQLVFFFSSSTRRMFCGRGDDLCERLVCRLGNLETGREATIQLEARLNPAVLLQAPGRHSTMMLENTARLSSPKDDPDTVLIQKQPTAQVVVEALFTHKPSMAVNVFIIVVSLVLGLIILAALIWCLWKVGFFKRDLMKKEEMMRHSWDYVPKNADRESYS